MSIHPDVTSILYNVHYYSTAYDFNAVVCENNICLMLNIDLEKLPFYLQNKEIATRIIGNQFYDDLKFLARLNYKLFSLENKGISHIE